MVYTPLPLRPCYKEYIWGGSHLKQYFGKRDAPDTVAESWELASHPDGESQVESGEWIGWTIKKLGELDHDGFWGTSCEVGRFPLIVKLIDAQRDLSIQVHPSDQSALPEEGEQGKAEMWYIVDCEPQAFLYLGFSRCITREEFLQRAQDGSICEVLNRVRVTKGDVFYIMPGVIHAIGAGILVAEIQQSSNTTFRIFDYWRQGANGNLRPLHLERAAAVTSFSLVFPEECKANSSVVLPGFTMVEMFSCPYFQAYRADVSDLATFCCDGRSFQHLLCVEGKGCIRAGNKSYSFHRGKSFFLPAALGEYQIQGECKVLLSHI